MFWLHTLASSGGGKKLNKEGQVLLNQLREGQTNGIQSEYTVLVEILSVLVEIFACWPGPGPWLAPPVSATADRANLGTLFRETKFLLRMSFVEFKVVFQPPNHVSVMCQQTCLRVVVLG